MNKLVYSFIAIFFFLSANSQVIIPTGNPNDDTYRQPFGTYYGYERTGAIYTAAEIGQTGNITQVGFWLSSKNNPSNTPVKIYLKMVTNDEFPNGGSTFASEIAGATLVYTGTIASASFAVNSWINVNLPIPFSYTGGANNLKVLVEANFGGTGGEGSTGKRFFWSSTNDKNRAQTWAQDRSAPTGKGSAVQEYEIIWNPFDIIFTYRRPNIRLNIVAAAPTISNVSPLALCVGEQVTITGENLAGATSVKIGAVSGSIVSSGNDEIIATFPSAVTGPVTVTTPTGSVTSSQSVTVNALPAAASLSLGGAVCDISRTITATGAGTGAIYYSTTPGVTDLSSLYTGTITVANIGNSTYYFRIKSLAGCFGPENSIDVLISNTTTPLSVSGAGTYCGTASISASGGAGGTIYFQGTDGTIGQHTNLGGTPQTITTSGTYYFQEQNSCGWGPISSGISVTINPIPAATIVSGPSTFCDVATLLASGETGSTIYFQGTTSGGTSTAFPSSSEIVSESGTYYFRSMSVDGCWGPEGSFTVTKSSTFTITTQPSDQTGCVGSSVTFSVTTSTTSGLTYQWRRGITNIPGANSDTYIIPSVVLSDARTDYNVLITDLCGAVISDNAELTVNAATPAPSSQPTVLTFPTIGVTSIVGTFVASPTAAGYLVVRTLTNVPPANPVNGTSYDEASTDLGVGTYVEYQGPNNYFSSNGLDPGTTYYYWIYAFNYNSCGASIIYRIPNPLTGNVTTATNVACASKSNIYWVGRGSVNYRNNGSNFNDWNNWSFSATGVRNNAAKVIPTKCNDVFIQLNTSVDISLSADAEIYSLTMYMDGNGGIFNPKSGNLIPNGNKLIINGNAEVYVKSGNRNTSATIGEFAGGTDGTVDFKANFYLGRKLNPVGGTNNPVSALTGNSKSTVIFRGDVEFGRLSALYTNNFPEEVIFDGADETTQQILWNNDIYFANLKNVRIGNEHSPKVQPKTGTYIPDNIYGNLTINQNASLNLRTFQWNRETSGGSLTLQNNAKLILGKEFSQLIPSGNGGVTVDGSNFPGGFSTVTMAPTSTVEYNGYNNVTQTVYNVPVYGNLILTNYQGNSGSAKKILTANMGGIKGDLTINQSTSFDLKSFNANRTTSGGNLEMGFNSKMLLAGNAVLSGGNNFPKNFVTKNLDNTSTVIYNSGDGVNQSVFYAVNYGNLTLQNSTGSGSSIKDLQSNILDIRGDLFIDKYVTFDLKDKLVNKSFSGGKLTLHNYANLKLSGTSGGQTGSNFPLNFSDIVINPRSGIEYYGANQSIFGGIDYANLTLAGTGTKSAPLPELNISENFTKSSATIFSHNSGLVQFNGVISQVYTSIAPFVDFYNINDFSIGGAGLNVGSPMNVFNELTYGGNSRMLLNGDVTIKSTAAQTARIAIIPAAVTIQYGSTGRFVIERYLPVHRKAWHLLAPNTKGSTISAAWQEGAQNTSAVAQDPNPGYGININGDKTTWSSNGFDYPQATLPAMKFYNSTSGLYEGVPSTIAVNSLNKKSGYFVFVRGDRSVTGSQTPKPTTLRSRGTIYQPYQLPPTLYSGAGEWILVGNPYASAIDFYQLGRTNLQTGYTIWDPNANNATNQFNTGIFRAITWDGFKLVAAPNDGNYSTSVPPIQSGEAFMVQSSSAAGSISFDETAKVSGSSNVPFFAKTKVNSPSSLRATLYSTKGGRELADGVLSLYSDEYSNDYDIWDAEKMPNSSENMGIASNGRILAIERRQVPGEKDTLLYDLDNWRLQNYQFAFVTEDMEGAGVQPYLNDRYLKTKTLIDLHDTTWVDISIINVPGSWAKNRFYVTFDATDALPVTLLSVTATPKNENVEVEWKTQNEVNVKEYEVEKSVDAQLFSKAATLLSTQRGSDTYNWLDEKAVMGWNYYRIRSIDKDGKSGLSKVVKVNVSTAPGLITVAPNPVVDGRINLRFKDEVSGIYNIRLLNSLGQPVLNKKINHDGGTNSYLINTTFKTPHELYQLEIKRPGGNIEVIKVIF